MKKLKKKKLLFISNKFNGNNYGGREKLTKLNYKILKKLFNKNFFFYKLKKNKINNFSKISKAIFGNIDGINNSRISDIKKIIKENKINYLFLDGSNLGKISRKLNSKDLKIVTFCHNVTTIRLTAESAPNCTTINKIIRIPTTVVIVSNSESRLPPSSFFLFFTSP